jgi:hypothetical protein
LALIRLVCQDYRRVGHLTIDHERADLEPVRLLIVTLLSSVVTIAAWARIRQRVTTRQNSAAGEALARPDTLAVG